MPPADDDDMPPADDDDDDNDDLEPQQHRHMEFAALFGWHPARGTMKDVSFLIGLAYLRVQSRTQSFGDLADSRGAFAMGFDWRLPLGESFAIVPQARAHVTTGTFVFRAGVGFQADF